MTLELSLGHRFAAFDLQAEFTAPQGVTALFGRSGSGKTTVVNAVAGLFRPESGRITLGGEVLFDSARGVWLPPHRRRLGYVFQDARLFPHLTVRQNLLYGARFHRAAAPPLDRIVALLDIAPLMARRPGDLSGGERQRVAIGRALLTAPRMLLMDEPLAALDAARKAEILPYLERLRDEAGLPILYVSHSMAEVARLATTVVLLDKGRVQRAGPVGEVLSEPALAPTIGLAEAGAVLPAILAAQEEDGLSRLETSAGSVFLPRLDAAVGSALRIRVSAQDVMLARVRPEAISALNILPGTITAIWRGTGPGALVQLRAGQDLLLARITQRSVQALDLTVGTPVHAVIKSLAVAQADVGLGPREGEG